MGSGNPVKGQCPGLIQAEQASCISELLFASPQTWQEKALLRYRNADGSWTQMSRSEVQQAVLRVAAWLESKGVKAGDRVGLLGHNCPEWYVADFAILRIGAVTVPAYFTDPPEAVQYVLNDAEVSAIFVEEGEQLQKLEGVNLPLLPFHGDESSVAAISRDEAWDRPIGAALPGRSQLATMIYTSGTTGHPKGVMLTHDNLLTDLVAALGGVAVFPEDLFLSFLPASHSFERTVGHFLPTACGSEIAYAESVTTLLRDMPEVKPTIMISVPRLYEKIYAGVQAKLAEGPPIKRKLFALAQKLGMQRFELRQRGGNLSGLSALLWRLLDHLVNAKLREKMGGRIRGFISGGAALHPDIARFLLAADIPVLPGYGLTETSPVLACNRFGAIKPETVGPVLPGVEFRVASDGELLVKGPMVMQGYWKKPEATAEVLEPDGWLHTGDIVEVDDEGCVKIIDRKKEIMVLSNGENVPPAVIEQHLMQSPAILQAMIVADNRPDVVALIVPDVEALKSMWIRSRNEPLPDNWKQDERVHAWMLDEMHNEEHDLSSFMQVKRFAFVEQEWTQNSGLLTPTLKLKRRKIAEQYGELIESLYPKQQSEE